MQSKITYRSSISMLDDETFGADERRTVVNSGVFILDNTRRTNSLFFVGKCGGELRIELSADVTQLDSGNITVSGRALLFEGTSEESTDLDGQRTFNQTINANTTGTISFRVNNTAEGGDYADISMEFTNLRLSDSDCTTNIKAKAEALGSAFTGAAVSNINAPLTVPNGKKVDFQHCDIYCSPSTGTHEVHGEIRRKYDAKGGPGSDLKLPDTDETATPDGQGRFNHFSGNGSIYWHPSTGPMSVRGAIRHTWATLGWERSLLGYPTSDEMHINSSPNQWYSDFQNGVIFWENSAEKIPKTASLTSAQLRNAVKNLFREKANDPKLTIDSVAIVSVSNTRYDFNRSKNRTITFEIKGEYQLDGLPDPDYTITLQLAFDANPMPNAQVATKIFVSLITGHVHTYNFAGIGTGQLANQLSAKLSEVFATPIDLTESQNIPAEAGLLSFKVMQDGGLKFFFRPDIAGTFAALSVQSFLNDMAS
jgi:LGFP repeat